MGGNDFASRPAKGASGADERRRGRLVRRAVAGCTAAALCLAALHGTASAAPAGAQLLESNVDVLVEDFLSETGVPGLTVAVSKNGRLLLSKGYGSAVVDGTAKLPMKRFMRTSIGSVSKAAVTGPASWQLLKQLGIDPATKRVYGPDGLFGGKFDTDIDQGIAASYPESQDWKQWYEKIKIQDLFDHTSGFQRDASKAEAAQMFGVTEEELTREQYHRFFLRTGKLLFEPGTDSEYSNHGFGLFALIVEELAGKDFYDYVRDSYLKPMNLHNGIQGSREHPDSCDSYNHYFDGDKSSLATSPIPPVKLLEFNESRLGLAQGGFRSSAQDLVLVTKNLDEMFAWSEIDRMGWFNSNGALNHSGEISGGTSYVVMFPDVFTTSSGADLGGVHVAVAANIELEAGVTSLAGKVALEVPASNVEDYHDLWPEVLGARSCEYSRHNVAASDYQSVFTKATKQGYQLGWLDGFTVDGKLYYNAIFSSPASGQWVSHHLMSGAGYQEKFDTYKAAGFSLVHVDSFPVGDSVGYAAIWRKNAGAVAAYHGKTVTEHQDLFDSLTAEGWKPKAISVTSLSGTRFYAALYNKQTVGSLEARSFLTAEQYQAKYDENKQAGRYLRYLNAYTHDGTLRFSAIWTSKPDIAFIKAKHGMSSAAYRAHWTINTNASYRTPAVAGYDQGGYARFAAFWVK